MTDKPDVPVYSQDYWDIVLSQVKRRPTVIISLVLLGFLYAVAIFAPLIANDRPLYFSGTDRVSYRKAQREILLAAGSLADHLEQGAAGFAAERSRAGETVTWEGTVKREIEAVDLRIRDLERQLAPADRRLLDEFQVAAKAASGLDGGGERAAAAAATIRTLSRRVETELVPAAAGEAPVPGRTVALVGYSSWPVIESLGRLDIYFMILMAMAIVWPLVNRLINTLVLRGDRPAIRRARRAKMLAFVVLPVLAAAAWQGKGASFYVSPYKDGLTSGEITAEKIVFTPVPFGLAENNNAESFRPPTWHPDSRITKEGYYESGARSGRFDRATGLPKMAQPVTVRTGEPELNSAWRHPLGTDSLGRDMLARLCWGARVSLAVGLVSTILLVVIGTILGSLAGYYGGWVDMVISRIIEIFQTFPVFFLILIVVAFIGPSILNIMLAIGLIRWTGEARLVRGEFIRLREQDFVVASRALGVRSARTIFRHVLPNALGPVLVAATFSVATGILTESALSFLGFGIQLPIPSWGSLLIESRSAEHWWIQIYPGLLIFITVMLYNLFGEGVRDALDPRLKVT